MTTEEPTHIVPGAGVSTLPMLIHCFECKVSAWSAGLAGSYVHQTLPGGGWRIFHEECVPDYFLALSGVEIRFFND